MLAALGLLAALFQGGVKAPSVDTTPAISVDAAMQLADFWLRRDSLPGVLICAYGTVEEDSINSVPVRVVVIEQVKIEEKCGGWDVGIVGGLQLLPRDNQYEEEQVKAVLAEVLSHRQDWIFAGVVHGLAPYRDPEHSNQLLLLGRVWAVYRSRQESTSDSPS